MGRKYQRSKIAETIGIGKETLRYYEARNIITPTREPGNGYRTYTGEDLTNLIMLKIKRSYGYSLEEAIREIPGFGEEEWEQHLSYMEDEIDRNIKKLERTKQIFEDQKLMSERARKEPLFLKFDEWNDEIFYLQQMKSEDVCSDKMTDSAVKTLTASCPMTFYGMKVSCNYINECSIAGSNGFEEYGCFWFKSDETLLPEICTAQLKCSVYPVKTVCRTVIISDGDDEAYYSQQEKIFRSIEKEGYRVSSDIIYRILPNSMHCDTYCFEMIIPVEHQ